METSVFNIKDGARTLTIHGVHLAHSSSEAVNKPRWIEFDLYRANSGVYVISRVGMSLYYHRGSCKVVERNRLSPVPEEGLEVRAIPCQECRPPSVDPEGLYPETPRYWSQVCQNPRGVLDSLTKYDDNDTEYLTKVARRLLEKASEVDEGIRKEYLEEVIS